MWRRDASDNPSRPDGAVLGVRLDRICHVDARRAARSGLVRDTAVRRVHRRRHRDRLAALSAAAVSAVRRRVLLWGPVVAYMAAIYYVSAQSAPPMVGPVVSDKVAHAIAYFGFGVLTFRAIAGGLLARVTPPRAAATMIL